MAPSSEKVACMEIGKTDKNELFFTKGPSILRSSLKQSFIT